MIRFIPDMTTQHNTEHSRTGMKIDSRSDVARAECRPPAFRTHRDYKQPRWATAHIESIDNVFATVSPGDVLGGDGSPKVRVDLDGLGEGGASLTEGDENVNASIWLTPAKASELIEQLQEARKKGVREHWSREEEVDQ
jgi:hypothetical protein